MSFVQTPKNGSASDLPSLLTAARAGSREALGILFERCRHYLLHVANADIDSDLQAKAGASDLVQQSFLEAQEGFVRFSGTTEKELLAWLKRILKNNLVNFARDFRALEKRQIGLEVSLEPPDQSSQPGMDVPANTPTPSARLVSKEELESLERALAKLPGEYSQVVFWRYRDGLTLVEIGRRLDCSPEAARKIWARAVERLQVELVKPDGTPTEG